MNLIYTEAQICLLSGNTLNLNLIKQGYPAGKNIYYECLICGVIVESRPEHFAECKCKNITVDTAGGRLSITDPTKFKIFKGRP
jgi:hypothetical protein